MSNNEKFTAFFIFTQWGMFGMKRLRLCVMTWSVLLSSLTASAADTKLLPAFPGAEGFGATTVGGRTGRVIAVTNLNDSGPGSLRQALLEKGPRVVVFRVSGVVTLRKDINIEDPFVTIAGQTAPGDGICLRGAGLRVRTHDVVVRYLRIRVGDDQLGAPPENRDGIGIGSEQATVHNVVIDHCSISWAIDENVQLWHPCHDITIQWCIISESLERSLHPKGEHGMGLLVGDQAKRISVHHNLFAHNMERNPLLKGDTETEVVNNVVYNWRKYATGLSDPEGSGPLKASIVSNLYLPGPQTSGHFGIGFEDDLTTGTEVFLRGNIGPKRPTDSADEWAIAASRAKITCRAEDPPIPGERITTAPIKTLRDVVLDEVGATLPQRDSIDQRVVNDTRRGTGKIINSPLEVSGWPDYLSAEAPTDSDQDGIPDDWEARHRLNSKDRSDNVKLAPSGYTWLEEYLNGLSAPSR
ncbi:MAG: hypothetical protein U0929_11810 [Planctomycetaceae bacterium]